MKTTPAALQIILKWVNSAVELLIFICSYLTAKLFITQECKKGRLRKPTSGLQQDRRASWWNNTSTLSEVRKIPEFFAEPNRKGVMDGIPQSVNVCSACTRTADNIHELLLNCHPQQLTNCREELSPPIPTTTRLIQKKLGLHFTVHTTREPEEKPGMFLPPSPSSRQTIYFPVPFPFWQAYATAHLQTSPVWTKYLKAT